MKKTVREKLAEVTELPKDFVMNMPRITLLGNKEIEIDNYKGILEYNTDIIRLSANKKQIVITGDELVITGLELNTIFIGGNIFKIEFCKKYQKPLPSEIN
ncbi:MAG: sporulation protein YqfC [Clostridia bacterium]|nr:sporulation protein YqfC [Clostridia bacterium]